MGGACNRLRSGMQLQPAVLLLMLLTCPAALPLPRPQATPLSPLPHAFVLAVIAAVAFPLNAWFDAASMEDWRAAEFWHEMDFAAWGFTQQAAQELDEQADL